MSSKPPRRVVNLVSLLFLLSSLQIPQVKFGVDQASFDQF